MLPIGLVHSRKNAPVHTGERARRATVHSEVPRDPLEAVAKLHVAHSTAGPRIRVVVAQEQHTDPTRLPRQPRSSSPSSPRSPKAARTALAQQSPAFHLLAHRVLFPARGYFLLLCWDHSIGSMRVDLLCFLLPPSMYATCLRTEVLLGRFLSIAFCHYCLSRPVLWKAPNRRGYRVAAMPRPGI